MKNKDSHRDAAYVQFSRSVVSDYLQPHESQHTRSPCPSQTPGVYSNSSPFESVMPSNHLIVCRPCLQSFPTQGLFK